MGLRKIIRKGDISLKKKSRPVTEFNVRLHILLNDMLETLKDADGVGLAAPQVGVLRRAVIVADISGEEPKYIAPRDASACPISGVSSPVRKRSGSKRRIASASPSSWRRRSFWPGPAAMRSII